MCVFSIILKQLWFRVEYIDSMFVDTSIQSAECLLYGFTAWLLEGIWFKGVSNV